MKEKERPYIPVKLWEALDEYLRRQRNLVMTRKDMKEHFIREMIVSSGMSRTVAEQMFGTIVKKRRAYLDRYRTSPAWDLDDLARKALGRKLRSRYAVEHLKLQRDELLSLGASTVCTFRPRLDTTECQAECQCVPCRFKVNGVPDFVVEEYLSDKTQ